MKSVYGGEIAVTSQSRRSCNHRINFNHSDVIKLNINDNVCNYYFRRVEYVIPLRQASCLRSSRYIPVLLD